MDSKLGRWWTGLTNGSAWSLPAFLGICLLLRLPAVLCADGYEYVDQQYQYVDPAWSLASGDAWLTTWEWIDGIRSWVYPWFLAGVFRIALLLGIEEPFAMMRVARGIHALVSLLPVWLFWLAVVRWRPLARPRLALLLFAGSGLVVTNAVQPSGPALGATLAIAAVVAFHGPGRRYPALGGLLLGLAFCCRYQEAVFGPAVVLVGLCQRRWSAALWFTAGCLPGIALQGAVDVAMGGGFLSSPWAYFEMNVLLGGASKWETRPWWFYLVAGVLPVLVLVPPWLGVALRRLRAGATVLPAAAAGAALHLIAHSCVARKALRFEYDALALLVAVVAAGLATMPEARRWSVSHRAALFLIHGLAWLWATFFVGHRGPIAAADALRHEPSFTGELLVVGGGQTSIGGAFYLRRKALQIDVIGPEDVVSRTAGGSPWLLAARNPLPDDVVAAARLELIGSYHGFLDLRRGDRRFVYRRAR